MALARRRHRRPQGGGYGHEAIVKLLLEKRADVKSKDGGGQTPLPRTVKGGHGHEAVVKLVLKKGAEKLLHWKRLRRRC
jgi:ankyrin repeat protein